MLTGDMELDSELEEELEQVIETEVEKVVEEKSSRESTRSGFLKTASVAVAGLVFAGFASAWSVIRPISHGVSELNVAMVNGHWINVGNDRPNAGDPGRLWHHTDGSGIYYDNGSSWVKIAE